VLLLNGDGSLRYVAEGDQPRWTPDHHALVVNRADFTQTPPVADLWSVPLEGGGTIRRITSTRPQQVRFFALGGSPPVVVYDDNRGVWAVNLDGSHQHSVFMNGPTDYSINELALSADGGKLAYVSQAVNSLGLSLHVVNLDGASGRVVFLGTENTCGIDSPSWSPDGRWIAFSLCTNKGGQTTVAGIWLIHPDGTGMHRLTPGSEPTWSPDGQWLAYVQSATQGDGFALFRIRADGTRSAQLTPYTSSTGSSGDDQPNW
jgi:Tol biopolymer transport system component